MNNYDLDRMISNRFNFGMESDQDIEINADQVIIDTDNDIAELNENALIANDASDNIDKVEEAEVTLEALIANMNNSLMVGGYDRRTAQVANIALESIATRFGLETTALNFGLEEVTADGEEETKSTIGKAKEMLGALKSNVGALLNKMYVSTLAALGNSTAISEKLIATATQLRSKINKDNKGGESITLKKSITRKLTTDGGPKVDPANYVKELKRLVDKYNKVISTYSDNDVLAKFVNDTIKNANTEDSVPASRNEIQRVVKTLNEDLVIRAKSSEDIEELQSKPYLGGAIISMKRPSQKAVKDLIAELSSKSKKGNVSQEAMADWRVKSGKHLLISGICWWIGATSLLSVGHVVIVGGGILPLVWCAAWSYWGIKKGSQYMDKALEKTDGSGITPTEDLLSVFGKTTEAVAETSAEYTVINPQTSNEAGEEVEGVRSLSAGQISDVLNIVQNTAGTTQTLKKELAKRKSLLKEIDKLVKLISVENKQNKNANNPNVRNAADFIKQFIKQTIKFELQLTTHCVSVMQASLAYVEKSNTQQELPAE